MRRLTSASPLLFFFFLFFSVCILFFSLFAGTGDASKVFKDGTAIGLKYEFYKDSCPQAEEVVSGIAENHFNNNPELSAGILRIYFHDCFVRGCDASLLLDVSPNMDDVEKYNAANNATLRGLDLIDDAKKALEVECPSTVSCADIVAFAARDAVNYAGLSHYRVPGGRRDGRATRGTESLYDLPSPFSNAGRLIHLFGKKGFTIEDLVVLSGAHSIGGAHCPSFMKRLYNYTGNPHRETQDPDLDDDYAEQLKQRCPKLGALPPEEVVAESIVTERVPFHSESNTKLGVHYYQDLMVGKGLLLSDQTLMRDKRTRKIVRRMAKDPERWAEKFEKAMVKLGALDVLVGTNGEIRKQCRETRYQQQIKSDVAEQAKQDQHPRQSNNYVR